MSGDTQNCYKSSRKGLPGGVHFIRPNVNMGKKGGSVVYKHQYEAITGISLNPLFDNSERNDS